MRTAIRCCIVASVLITAIQCEAGGFFRRVPEVGEWARYEMNFRIKTSVGPKGPPMTHETEGVFTLKCVGSEEIDNTRHLWIECRFDYAPPEGEAFGTIYKILIPEDQILGGELTSENTRGWTAPVDSEPQPLAFSSGASDKDSAAGTLMMLFGGSNPVAGQQAERTVVVNDVEVELDHLETGSASGHEFVDMSVNLAATWWPHEDLAFGIASADLVWTMTYANEILGDAQTDARFDLVATGTDAVSDLPDHN